jgi:hypothetical protein
MAAPTDTHHQGRVVAGTEETELVNADAALTGWGTTPSVAAAAGSKDHRGRLSVTTGTTPSANPTVVVTFKRPYASTPFIAVSRGDIAAPTTGWWAITARSATGFTATFVGTPVAASVYVLDWQAEE